MVVCCGDKGAAMMCVGSAVVELCGGIVVSAVW